MAAFLHFCANAVGVNLELEVSGRKEEDRERKKRCCNKTGKGRRQVVRNQTESNKDKKKGTDILFGHSADYDSHSISSTPKLRCSSCADGL